MKLGLICRPLPPRADLLRNLRTLIVHRTLRKDLCDALLTADLPHLQTLGFAAFASQHSLLCALLDTHGHKLESLTILPDPTPEFRLLAPTQTLLDLPFDLRPLVRLRHLAVLPFAAPTFLLEALKQPPSLHSITLPKWEREAQSTTDLLEWLLEHPVVKQIRVDGLKWAPKHLGIKALETGSSGDMRDWAGRLRFVGIELMDMEGERMPVFEVGRRCSRGRGLWMGFERTERDPEDDDGA